MIVFGLLFNHFKKLSDQYELDATAKTVAEAMHPVKQSKEQTLADIEYCKSHGLPYDVIGEGEQYEHVVCIDEKGVLRNEQESNN